MKHFTLFVSALIGGMFLTTSVSAQQKEYTDGVFMLNEGWFGNEKATINYLDKAGKWEYRVALAKNSETYELGTTGCYATIDDGKMYIVSKKKSVADKEANDPTLTVCDAKTMEVIAQINTILNADGTAAADGRAFLPVKELGKGFLSTTEGVFTFNLDDNTVGSLIAGTDGLANNQTGNMVYADGKVYAVDLHRGLLVIDAAEGKLLKTVNNEGEGSYNSIVQAKDGSIWLTCSKSTKAVAHIVKFNPSDYSTETVELPEGVYPPTNSWGAWNPDCFTASTTENALFWNGATGDWTNGQHIYKFDIDSRQVSLLLDFTAAEEKPYVYGAACRMNPYSGDLYLSITKGSAWGDESELRVYDATTGSLKQSYPMEKHFWFPEMPVFALKSTTAISSVEDNADVREVARYSVDGKLLQGAQKGLNIVRYSDGTVKKVVVK